MTKHSGSSVDLQWHLAAWISILFPLLLVLCRTSNSGNRPPGVRPGVCLLCRCYRVTHLPVNLLSDLKRSWRRLSKPEKSQKFCGGATSECIHLCIIFLLLRSLSRFPWCVTLHCASSPYEFAHSLFFSTRSTYNHPLSSKLHHGALVNTLFRATEKNTPHISSWNTGATKGIWTGSTKTRAQ